ncbi:MAG TPA: hypothetical protein VFG12_02540 [Rhodopila sp.]|nr:hypothetical protein [Rhodopila sp.]
MIWLPVAGLLFAAGAKAETIGAPHVTAGDTWTYQITVEDKTGWHQRRDETTVERAGPATIAVDVKQAGSTMPPKEQLTGADWSRTRSVNGHETTVNRPLAFPLSIGKTWTVEYAEEHPNRQHSNEHWKHVYKVTGWEDVTVPAGTFHALKIEADGEWTATVAPAVSAVGGARVDAQGSTTVVRTARTLPTTAAGRSYMAFWYVPAAKKWVKSVEEYYDSNGVRNQRFTSELISFHVDN